MDENKQKRNRLPNFTVAEETLLLELAEPRVHVIENKSNDGHTWERKRRAWQEIDDELTKRFGLRRGAKNIREKYENLKRKLKRSYFQPEENIEKNILQQQRNIENIRLQEQRKIEKRLAEILYGLGNDAAIPNKAENEWYTEHDDTVLSTDDPIRFMFECEENDTMQSNLQTAENDAIQDTDSQENDSAQDTKPKENEARQVSETPENEPRQNTPEPQENETFSNMDFSWQLAQQRKAKSNLKRTSNNAKKADEISDQKNIPNQSINQSYHSFAVERHKREAEKHKWEIEKLKWDIKVSKLKAKILKQKLQQSQHRETASSACSTMSDTDDLRIETVTSHKISNNFRPPHSSSEEIKVEPDLDITNTTVNISNDDLILPDTLNMQKRLADIDADEDPLSCSNKRVRLTQNRADQQQWDVVLNNDAPCATKNAENRLDASHLTNVADSDSDDDDDNDDDNNDADDNNDDADNACNTLNTTEEVTQQAHSSSKAAHKHYESDECRFFKLLTKYKLQNYADKLKEIRIDLDCLKHIREDDIKDIFEKDVGARIRFRAVVEDWRASHMHFNSVFNQQLRNNSKAGDVVTKKDIAELKSFIKNAQNTFLQEQQKTRDLLQRAPQEQTNQYNPESTVRNHAHKEVLPKRAFDTIIDFKNFEDVITDSEEAYTSLISELINLASKDSVGYIKSCWRRIMTDNVAKHFCWTGTPEKPAIRELHVTSALREAYLRKYQYGSMDEFQRTIIAFFQYAKTRLQKKENYEKVKAAAI